MTRTSAPSRSDKTGKNSKGVPLANVKDEFASSHKRNTCTKKIEYEILKENHETLKIDYESLERRVKVAEETYEVMKKLLQGKKGQGLEEDGARERNEKEKMESEGKVKIDELRKREEELLMAIRKGEEDSAKLDDKFVALAERFCVVEADCAYLKSLYDAEVAAASGIGVNKLNNNVKKNDATVISDQNDPPRESKRSQEEQCKNQGIFTPASSPSSSSSSSDGYDVVFKLPANWPDWAIPKGPGDGSSKS